MAVTWSFAAVPGTVDSKYKGAYGPSGSGVAAVKSTANGRREVVVRVTTGGAGNTYTTGGDALPAIGLVGLTEVREAYAVADNALTIVCERLALDLTDPKAPKVMLFDAAGQIANGAAVNSRNHTIVLVGT